jgi:hypothetical protein
MRSMEFYSRVTVERAMKVARLPLSGPWKTTCIVLLKI